MALCYIATKEDAAVAALIQGWNANDVARLRGMWEETHLDKEGKPKVFDLSDPRKAATYLVEHRNELLTKVINTSTEHMADSYLRLREAYADNPEAKMDRVNMIATLFSRVLDLMQAAGDKHSRTEICNGYVENGVLKGGQFRIFETVYNQLRSQYSKFYEEEDYYGAEEIAKVLDNWGAFTAFARITLRDTEGVKLGNRIEYAVDSDGNNYGENDLSSLFNVEESKREGWQEMNEFISAFGTMKKAVRRVLGNIQIYSNDLAREIAEEEGKEIDPADGWVTDDLGFAKKLNPVTAHQTLMSELRGIINEADMLNRLRKSNIEWVPSLVKILENNPQIRTQFYVDFCKDFQPYKGMSLKIEKGIHNISTYIMNKVQNILGGEYRARIKMGKTLSPNSVYSSNGQVNWQNVAKLRSSVNEWFTQKTTTVGALVSKKKSKFWESNVSWNKRASVIVDMAKSLGINLDTNTALRILKSNKSNKLISQLQELFTHINSKGSSVSTGFDALLTGKELEELSSGNFANLEAKRKAFKDLLKEQSASQEQLSKKGNIEEKIEKILDIIAEERELKRIEDRVTHKDKKGKSNTMYSNVNPSFLGTFMKTINSYAKNKDSKGLTNYLLRKYGNGSTFSSMFYMNGEYLNKWLEELLKEDLDKEGNFAETIMYSRFLGSENLDFENFTSKQHIIEMMHEYLFAENSRDPEGRKYGHYPVFILGDSGVSKYIKAKRYTKDEILEGLYKVYKSERRRMELTKAVNTKLAGEGIIKGISNFSNKTEEFTILTFLNDPEVRREINEKVKKGYSTETAVKEAIKDFMNSSVMRFNNHLTALGVNEMMDLNMGNSTVKVPKYFYKQAKEYDKSFNGIIEDFYWNSKFATIQQLQLMTIDPGFYKGTKDLQKRYKEIHAPGTSLSIEALDFNGNRYSEDGIERCIYFNDISVNAEDVNPEFMQAIRYHFGEDSRWKKYLDNTLTDGQGYRTLDSYRKVKGMAGEWTLEMENAYNQIKSLRSTYGDNKPIPAEELERIAELAQVFMPIKPYMYTFENVSVGTDILKVPVQHKYAEAVLIPELLPNDSMLKDLALAMETKNIDLVCSTTVVKVGNFGAVDLSKAKDRDSINNIVENAYVHQLSYEDYKIQTNVPEHVNGSQLFGTQLKKLIMGGVNLDADYSSYTDGHKVNLGNGQMATLNGRNLVNFYNSLIVSNTLAAWHQFEGEVSNPKLLSNALQQSIINNSRESLDNLLAYAVDKDGNFRIPLFEGGLEHDTSALLLSIFKKKVNKQKVKGGSLVQVSAMGISGYEEDGGLSYVCCDKDGNIIRHTDSDYEEKKHLITNVLYAEVEVPFDLSVRINGKEVPLKFSDYCHEDGTLIEKNGKPLIETRFPGILDRISYRIPTERDYSIMNTKIKRFSQRTAGGTIKVPAQGTVIAGFDFDIDKLYFMMREYHVKENNQEQKLLQTLFSDIFHGEIADTMMSVLELEEYDYNKSPLEQGSTPEVGVALRNNMLIDLISKRLMDEETFNERYTPGGFANKSKAAREMRELLYGDTEGLLGNEGFNFTELERRSKENKDPEPNYDPTDPMTIVIYNQQNQVAGKLIGIFANQNTNHAFASLMKEFKLVTPISFCGHSYSDLLHAPDGIDTSLNIAECLSASVDAVKDPVLNFLNFNTVTADAGGMLARLGYTGREIGLLFNQPIIKELCDTVFNEGISVDAAIYELKNIYLQQLKEQGGNTIDPTDTMFSASTLAKNIIEDRKQREKATNSKDLKWSIKKIQAQLNILDKFAEIYQTAGELSNFVTSTKFTASNAVGSTFGDMYSQQIKVKNYIASFSRKDPKIIMKVTDSITTPINNEESYGMSDEEYINRLICSGLGNPFAYEQAIYDMNRRAIKLLNKYYPYDNDVYVEIRNLAAKLTKAQFLDADTINSIHNDLLVYMLAQQENSLFDEESQSNGLIINGERISNRDYYTKIFPERVTSLIEGNPSYKEDFAIFKYMFPTENEAEELELRIQDVGGLNTAQKDIIRDSWTALMQEDPNLARDLFMYNYYRLGFGFSPRAFMHLAPMAIKESIMVNNDTSYIQFLNDVLKGSRKGVNSTEFIKQYIRNHSDNYRFVYTARGDLGKAIRSKAVPNRSWLSSFELGANDLGDDRSLYINDPTINSKVKVAFMPCIAIPDGDSVMLYMAQSNSDERFNVTGKSNKMTYVKVGRLGITNKSLSYQYGGSRTSKIDSTKLNDDSKIKGTTSPETDPIISTDGKIDRQAIIDEIIEGVIKEEIEDGSLVVEGINNRKSELQEQLKGVNDTDLLDTVNAIRNESTDNVVDSTGNKVC